ncbi:MAG: hypothetical protein P8129_19970, partial [Anaerolineae bacterium]
MKSLVLWAEIAVVAWAAGLLVVLVSEVRWLRRLVPDWLHGLSRIIVLVGTIGLLTMTVLFGSRVMISSLQARAETGTPADLNLSFESADSFFLSLYLSMHQAELNEPAGDDPTAVSFAVESGETA